MVRTPTLPSLPSWRQRVALTLWSALAVGGRLSEVASEEGASE